MSSTPCSASKASNCRRQNTRPARVNFRSKLNQVHTQAARAGTCTKHRHQAHAPSTGTTRHMQQAQAPGTCNKHRHKAQATGEHRTATSHQYKQQVSIEPQHLINTSNRQASNRSLSSIQATGKYRTATSHQMDGRKSQGSELG